MKLYKIIPHPFYGWGYRTISKLLHRLNLHYAPARLIPDGEGGGVLHRWCHWCGMRHSERWWPPDMPLEERLVRLQREQEAKA